MGVHRALLEGNAIQGSRLRIFAIAIIGIAGVERELAVGRGLRLRLEPGQRRPVLLDLARGGGEELLESRLGGVHRDRKSVVTGKSVSVRVDLGGRMSIKKKQQISTSI